MRPLDFVLIPGDGLHGSINGKLLIGMLALLKISRKIKKGQKEFAKGGSDLPSMLRKQMNNEIDSWMIRWVFQQFKNNQLDVFPRVSKVINIGFSDQATHTNCSSLRYKTILDKSDLRTFTFPKIVEPNAIILKQFKRKISIERRIFYKLLDLTGISKLLMRF